MDSNLLTVYWPGAGALAASSGQMNGPSPNIVATNASQLTEVRGSLCHILSKDGRLEGKNI